MNSKFRPLAIALIAIIVILAVRYALSNLMRGQSPEQDIGRQGADQKTAVVGRMGTGVPASLNGKAKSLSDYQVVVEHDLLRPLGWQKTLATQPSPEPVVREREQRMPPSSPPNELVLTGIVQLGAEYIALVEDVSRKEAYFLKEGDKLKGYLVDSIGEEGITLVGESSELSTSLGTRAHYDSSGRIFTSQPTGYRVVEDVSERAVQEISSSDSDSADLSVIERLKARRRKELGQE